jgi:DNA polymerase-1
MNNLNPYYLVLDIETDAITNPSTIHCIVGRKVYNKSADTSGGDEHIVYRPKLDKHLLELPWESRGFPHKPDQINGLCDEDSWKQTIDNAIAVVGHNIIGYDIPVLEKILPSFRFNRTKVIDTLVVSQLLYYNIPNGHSLESWGERLGFQKIKFNDFSRFTNEMLTYCKRDVDVTVKLFNIFSDYIHSPDWKTSLRLEHDIAWLCGDLHNNGFAFDKAKALTLHAQIQEELNQLENELRIAFPARSKLIREITPSVTKHGTLHKKDFKWLQSNDLTSYTAGATFSLIDFELFNPGSPKQCVERLNQSGWKPTEKTKGHIQAEREKDQEKLEHYKVYGWTVSESNLSTLPLTAPKAAHKLVRWLLVASRRSTLEEWFKAYDDRTGRIHGRFRHIGAWTGRMSHAGPNMANIPSHGSAYGDEFRSLWHAKKNFKLVGVDADAIQLRVLAHYMNDSRFTAALVSGRKEEGTDAHTLNKLALGSVCKDRDTAKTFIYAWLLGAGNSKIAQILDCSNFDAKDAIESFLSYYPGLEKLRSEKIPYDARRGYFIGFDGRKVVCDSEHLMLAGYLQNGEALIMKQANLLWQAKARENNLCFKQVNFVHDEWQVEVPDLTTANSLGILMVQSIVDAGELFKLNCPLAGNSKIGYSWLDTH